MSEKLAPLNPPRRLLFGPGPTMVEPRVYKAMTRTVVSHFNKAHKGALARVLASGRSDPTDAAAVVAVARRAGVPFTGFWLEAPERVLTERLASEWQAFSYWLYHDRQDGSLRLGAGSMIGTLLTDASPDYLRSLLAKISDLPERVRDTFLSQAANAPARMPRRPPLRDSTGAGVSRG